MKKEGNYQSNAQGGGDDGVRGDYGTSAGATITPWDIYTRSITGPEGFSVGDTGNVQFRVRDVGTEREVECYIFWSGTGIAEGAGSLSLPISEFDTLACDGTRMMPIQGGEAEPLEVIFYVTARSADVVNVPGNVLNGDTFDSFTTVGAPAQSVLVEQLGTPTSGITWVLKFSVPSKPAIE